MSHQNINFACGTSDIEIEPAEINETLPERMPDSLVLRRGWARVTYTRERAETLPGRGDVVSVPRELLSKLTYYAGKYEPPLISGNLCGVVELETVMSAANILLNP